MLHCEALAFLTFYHQPLFKCTLYRVDERKTKYKSVLKLVDFENIKPHAQQYNPYASISSCHNEVWHVLCVFSTS